MPRESPAAGTEADAAEVQRVRAELGALTLLGFWTPPEHEAHARARELDKGLVPVRACARAAFSRLPRRDRPMRPETLAQARAALERCWALVDEAAVTIDTADWWLDPATTTRAWAERHVAHVAAHAAGVVRDAK